VTDDFKIRDSRRAWRLSLGYVVPHMPLELAVTVEGIGRRGNILEVSDHYRENKIYYHLNVLF